MLIAKGYSVTHFDSSSPIGSGNAVLYGHDDIEGSVFGRLKDLASGDEIDITPAGASLVVYHVTGPHKFVQPNAVQILNPTNDVRLTLVHLLAQLGRHAAGGRHGGTDQLVALRG